MGRQDQIINERKKKLDEMRKEGINPYPAKYNKILILILQTLKKNMLNSKMMKEQRTK